MFHFKNLSVAIILIMSNFSTSASYVAPQSLCIITELEANSRVISFTSFSSHGFKMYRHLRITSCLSSSPKNLSIGYLHFSPDHYLFWQSPFLPVTFLKVNIFLSAMGLNTDVLTRLGSSREFNRVHLLSQMLCVYVYDGEKWIRKLLLLFFHPGRTKYLTGLHLTPFISF